MNSILCPKCKEPVEISEALSHQIREKILMEVDGKHKEEIERLTTELQERAAKKAKEESEFVIKNLQTELAESTERNKKFHEQLMEFSKQMRELKLRDEERELEFRKQLLKERELMENEITKSEQEKSRLEKMELQKQLDDTKKALEDAQRKAAQSSQQLQGEVLELDLEQQLQSEFQFDEITPVPKGIDGADIIQKVRNKFGKTAGVIIWETKRTKAWSSTWTPKLREDARTLGADTAILISDVLPNGIETFGFYENVWVSTYKYALSLACVIRISILQVAQAKSAVANKDDKLEMLYQYLTNASFKHRFEAQVESISEMRSDLEQEQRAMTRMWKKKDMQIQRMMRSVAGLYGELQGILGSALPSIQGLELQALPDGNEPIVSNGSESITDTFSPVQKPLHADSVDVESDPQTLF